jgi:hypothetical protein
MRSTPERDTYITKKLMNTLVFPHGLFPVNKYCVGIVNNTVEDGFRKRAFPDFCLPAGRVELGRKDG